jgi:hypothetical protein
MPGIQVYHIYKSNEWERQLTTLAFLCIVVQQTHTVPCLSLVDCRSGLPSLVEGYNFRSLFFLGSALDLACRVTIYIWESFF